MEIVFSTFVILHFSPFKIDLIVWKCGSMAHGSWNGVPFKIDLIVWKCK